MSKLTKTKQSSQQPAHNNTHSPNTTNTRDTLETAATTGSRHQHARTVEDASGKYPHYYLASHNITQLLIFLMLSMSCLVSVSVSVVSYFSHCLITNTDGDILRIIITCNSMFETEE